MTIAVLLLAAGFAPGPEDADSRVTPAEVQEILIVVWSTTKAVGCGAHSCTAVEGAPGGGTVFVCDYRPAGNVVGHRPY